MSTHHIPKDQLELFLRGEQDDKLEQQYGLHLENCAKCQAALDAIAASPKLWQKASELISEPLMSELAVKRATASFDAHADELLNDSDPMSRNSAEFVLDPPSHPEMLGRIGGYDVEREVGRGGMGIVFKAFDTELHRPLAVKVLAPWLAQNATARKRFNREARAAAAVIHPNVISIYGVNVTKKTPYLVMPFVAGPSLQRLIDEHGPLNEKDIVRIAMQVSAGLGAAHAQGLVHRDIKPPNILVEPEVSRVLVTDFGLARAVDDASATHSGYFVGTPNYMSPEQATGKRIDGRSDLFSLGSVIYFMATGRMPYRADSPICVLNRITHDEPTDVQQVNNEISRTLSDVVRKLLAKNPEDRFQSAGELYEMLEMHLAFLHQPDISKPPTVALRQPPNESAPSSRNWLVSVVGVGALVAAIALSFARGWLPTPNFATALFGPTSVASGNDDATARRRADEKEKDPAATNRGAGGWNNEQAKPATSKAPWTDGSTKNSKLGGSSESGRNKPTPRWGEAIVGDVGVPGEFVTVKRSGLGKNIDGYTVYLPESYAKNAAPFPVILYLQGGLGVGGEVSVVNQWGLPELVSKHRQEENELSRLIRDQFVIISPHIVDGDYFEDVSAMTSILQEVAEKHRTDPSRVYLTGLSLGAAGTWAMASRMEGVFAAAAPLGGQVYGIQHKKLLAKIPMWVAHNTGDNFTPIAKIVTKINRLSKVPFKAIDARSELAEDDLGHPRIFMTGETSEHDAWSRVYKDPMFYRWLLRQRHG